MTWITRERPKIDCIACPWLIRRFIDPQAQILFVPAGEVVARAAALGATPFDVPGVEFSHYGSECTFDYFLRKYNLCDPALHVIAPIVRGADTDNQALAEQAAGLWAISAGLAHNHPDDAELLQKGLLLYDALYSWATHLQGVKHTQNPTENRLMERLYQQSHAWALVGLRFSDQYLIFNNQRSRDLIALNAEERYRKLLRDEPGLAASVHRRRAADAQPDSAQTHFLTFIQEQPPSRA